MSTNLPRISECRDCHDPIRFVQNVVTGKAIAVNPAPNTDRGTVVARVVLTAKGRALHGYPLSVMRDPKPEFPLRFTVHAVTCTARPRPIAPEPTPEPAPADVDAPLF